MSEAPHDMGRDMADRKSGTDAEALADELVDLGYEEASRLIEARKPKRKLGRPEGLKYQKVDQQMLLLAAALLIEWEKRLGKRVPLSRHALLTKIVDLCLDHEACKIAGMWFVNLGPSKRSIVARLLTREATLYGDRAKAFIPMMKPPKGSDRGMLGMWPSPEVWEVVHRLRPDLSLLP
jgi:hypothetical protein